MRVGYRVTSNHFVAGFETDGAGNVVKAAPIIKYFVNYKFKKLLELCKKNEWKVEKC